MIKAILREWARFRATRIEKPRFLILNDVSAKVLQRELHKQHESDNQIQGVDTGRLNLEIDTLFGMKVIILPNDIKIKGNGIFLIKA